MPHTLKSVALRFVFAFVIFILASLFSRLDVHFFAPPLVMLITMGTLMQTMTTSLIIGCFLDIATHSPRLGFIALSYLLTSYTLYSCKRLLTHDSFVSLPLLTYIFSMLTSLFHIIIAFLFDIPLPSQTAAWIIQDAFLMPLFDVAYAIFVFSLPHYLFSRYHLPDKRMNRRM